MRKNKRRRKKRIVLIILSIIMIIIGGFIIMKDKIFSDNKIIDNHDIDTKEEFNNDKEEILDSEDNNEDSFSEGTDTDDKEESDAVDVTLKKAPLNNNEYKNLSDGSYITDKGYTLKIENGIATIDGILIVNKTYSLPSSYGGELTSEVMKAFNSMNADAVVLGLNLWIQSGYRSYDRQNAIYNNYVNSDGRDNADTYSARAGHSEHQTGLAFDLNTIDDSFAYTDEGKWVNDNCYRYGFVLRYPKGKNSITGYIYESWHLRYVGVELAEKLYNNGDWLTLEEYYGISSSY